MARPAYEALLMQNYNAPGMVALISPSTGIIFNGRWSGNDDRAVARGLFGMNVIRPTKVGVDGQLRIIGLQADGETPIATDVPFGYLNLYTDGSIPI